MLDKGTMLAPRRKLWSSPKEAVECAAKWVPLRPNDVVCDIGCGDGRVLVQWAAIWSSQQQTQQQIEEQQQLMPSGESFVSNNNMTSRNNDDENDFSYRASSVQFIGLDINPDRIQEARTALKKAKDEGHIHKNVKVTFHCANALDAPQLIENASVFFLYLVPRGLRLIKPVLLNVASLRSKRGKILDNGENSAIKDGANDEILLRVVTYMSPLPGETYSKKDLCQVEHQPGAAWPVYLYHLAATCISQSDSDKDTG